MKTKKDIDPRRAQLIEYSNLVKPLIEMEEYTNINEAIINEIYTTDQETEFNTYKGWKEKGYQVMKGEKAKAIWSRPLKGKKREEAEKQEGDNTTKEDKKYKFYGIAYLFSNTQVQKI